jgi:methionine aminotransferase
LEEKHISSAYTHQTAEPLRDDFSFGKSFHITGWKVGYLVAPEYLMKEIKKVHQFWFSVSTVYAR